MQFVDYKKIIQERLDSISSGLFEVTNERNIRANNEKVNVVLKQLVGQVLNNSATIPYQLDIFTTDIDKVMDVFTYYARTYSNHQFTSMVNEGTEEEPNLRTYNSIIMLFPV